MFGLEAVWRDGEVVGHIRRADFGFAIDKTIAYGYICDPTGGPVSTDPPRDGCASLPAAGAGRGERGTRLVLKPYGQAHCKPAVILGSAVGQPPCASPHHRGWRVRGAVAQRRGRSHRLSLCGTPAMPSGSSACLIH